LVNKLIGFFRWALPALLLAGCAAPQTQALLHGQPRLPQRAELAQVPFFPQEAHQCGPASLATALGAAGVPATPQSLVSEVYLPGREGSLQVEMFAAPRRHGLISYQLAPRLEDLLTEVAAGNPVLVLQNLALDWYPLWHYAVVVGYDLGQDEIVLRSGLQRRQTMPLATFEHTWERAGYWGMVVLPPGRMPQTAGESDYLASVLALEKSGQRKGARAAYAAALNRWPKSLTAQIGVGNTAYALGDLRGAEEAFRTATLDHPDSAVAYNNLAQTLADEGHYGAALKAARVAVNLGGPLDKDFRRTLGDIQRHLDGK
jgi:tetratricopeptide (TPR) repeat protein